MRYCIFLLLLALLHASCAQIAPAPRDMAPEPGALVGKKPESQEILAQPVFEGQGVVRPESGEILRQLEANNRQFNERVREVIDRSPRRMSGAVEPGEDAQLELLSEDAQPLSMDFYDADLLEVIRLFMSLLDADYILHPQVSGRVSLSVEDTFRPEQILDLLQGLLRINGMAMTSSDGVWEIMPLGDIPRQISKGWLHVPEDGLTPRRGQMIQAFRLHFISASDMSTIIQPYLSSGAQISAHDGNGVMLVCDYPHNLLKASQLIQVFDVSVFAGVYTATYALKYVQAEDAAKELEEVAKTFGLGGEGGGMQSQVSFLPLARLNMLLVLARDEQVLDFADVWVSELDRELPPYIEEQYGEGVYVYYAQFGNAAEIVASLQGLFEYTEPAEDEKDGSQPPKQQEPAQEPPQPEEESPEVVTEEFPPLISQSPFPTPGPDTTAAATGKLTGPVTFVVDEPNNAVLIRCSTADYPKISSVIEQIDQYPRQVLIEVVIAEVTLSEDTRLGMEWSTLDYRDGVQQSLSLTTGSSGLEQITSGISYMVQNTGRLMATIKASAADGHVRILSTPTLLASDNKEALINIGDEVPVATSKTVRTDSTDVNERTEYTYQYRDTGIILKVTPKINKQGMVRMEISQEVSDWYENPRIGPEQPIITTRHAQTHVAVNDQQTIVIGGLMEQQQRHNVTGVPGLSRVPLLKYLFGAEQKSFDNTELMIFITPHVVVGEEDSTFITRDFKTRLERIKAGMR